MRKAVIDFLSGLSVSGAAIARPRPPDDLRCPGCGTALEGRLGTRPLSATRDEEGGVDPVVVVYCRACGRVLGAYAGPGG